MSASLRGPAADTVTACFSVHASADPGVMTRVIQVFSRRGMVPTAWHSSVVGSDGAELQIDVQMAGIEAAQSELLAESMRRIVNVACVLTSEKRSALTA